MNDIAIYGAGGFGRETLLLIRQINAVSKQWNVIGYYDDHITAGTLVDNLPVLGGLNSLLKHSGHLALVIAVADPMLRRQIAANISNKHFAFPSLIHPNSIIDIDQNRIGKGCIITANCVFTTGITLGEFVIVNLACTVGHDVALGDFCSLMPGNHISGNCTIGECTMIGTGARTLQNLTIGKRCKVGAGAVVISDFDDDLTIVGVPGRAVVR